MSKTQSKNRFIRLLNYSGNYKYLSIIGMILSALSAISLFKNVGWIQPVHSVES